MLKTGASYFGSRIQKHVKEDMKDMAAHNCNFVVHTFSEADLAFYNGTMREIADISREAGLKVWVDPWAVGGVFGGESFSKFVSENLDARQVSNKTGELLSAACLNNDKFRKFMLAWVDAAIDLGADVIFWDEPHFYLYPLVEMERDPALWACKCETCRLKFKERFGYEMPSELNDDIKLFKEDSIVDFLKSMCDYVKGRGAPTRDQVVRNAVCFLTFKGELGGIMDWAKAARIDSLDIIGTDPYWRAGEKDVAGLVGRFSKKIYDLAEQHQKEGQIWILNFRIKEGTEKDIETAVMAAHAEGINNIAAWSYGGTGCMSSLASDNPKKVWEVLSSSFARIKRLSAKKL